jgi:hypothetical protein
MKMNTKKWKWTHECQVLTAFLLDRGGRQSGKK